jgi:hypothetical protein
MTNVYDKPDSINANADESKDLAELNIELANKLWKDLKDRIKDNPSFIKKSDAEKIETYQTSEFKVFYTNFPIVCRYMICMGQFSNKAFKRYLMKCKMMENKRTPDYNAEDEWVKRQADYVRYLWEAYQKQHFNANDAKNIWQHAYKTLSQEFVDFKKLHTEVEAKLKNDDQYNKASMVKELLQRVSNEEQSLDSDTTNTLIKKLEDKLYIQRKKKLLDQIIKDVKKIEPSRICRGSVRD